MDTREPTLDELERLADAIGGNADGFELDMPDGSTVRGYRAPAVLGPLPEGWRAYYVLECENDHWIPYPGHEDIAEDEREDGENGRYGTSLVIDDSPGPHIVDQGDPFVTASDLSGVGREFDEDHCGYDGVSLADDIARLSAPAMAASGPVLASGPVR